MILVVAQGNDWSGIYMNGVLLTQGHSISAIDLLRAVDGYNFQGRIYTEVRQVDVDWLEDQGMMPQNIGDVKFKERA